MTNRQAGSLAIYLGGAFAVAFILLLSFAGTEWRRVFGIGLTMSLSAMAVGASWRARHREEARDEDAEEQSGDASGEREEARAGAHLSLVSALEAVFEPGADWSEILGYPFRQGPRNGVEALAVCVGLKRLLDRPDLMEPRPERYPGKRGAIVHEFAAMFQAAESPEAAQVLFREGLPPLTELFDRICGTEDSDDHLVLFVLKVLVMYHSPGALERVVRVLRSGRYADTYWWVPVLNQFGDADREDAADLFGQMARELPKGFSAVALLDAANAHMIAGGRIAHPFDNPDGTARLESFLASSNPDEHSYALSATAALPFLSARERDRLLALALDHIDRDVQIEAAWALGRMGNERGIALLTRFCRDVHTASKAGGYLGELGRNEAIPDECQDPKFAALAEMSQWLQHPNEFGRAPEGMEVLDTRELHWPPERDWRRLWLIRYTYPPEEPEGEPEVGIGLVGSTTFSFFGDLAQETPERAYASHCVWELEQVDDPRVANLERDKRIEAGLKILRKHNPGAF